MKKTEESRNLYCCLFRLTNNDITNFFAARSAFGEPGGTPPTKNFGEVLLETVVLLLNIFSHRTVELCALSLY